MMINLIGEHIGNLEWHNTLRHIRYTAYNPSQISLANFISFGDQSRARKVLLVYRVNYYDLFAPFFGDRVDSGETQIETKTVL